MPWFFSLTHVRQCGPWIEYEPQHKTCPKSLAVWSGMRTLTLSFCYYKTVGCLHWSNQRKEKLSAESWLRLGWLVYSLNQLWESTERSSRYTLTGNIFVVDQIYLVLIAKRDHTLGRILGCLTVKDIMKDFIGFVHCLGKLRKGSRKKGFAFIVCCLGQW